jgi:hypothetical protein
MSILIRPPKPPVTNTIAVLTYTADLVQARLPEKHEDFREVVKARGYHWNGWNRVWEKHINGQTGPSLHRAAEVGRALLEAGFIVDFPDQAVLDLAVSGEWEPECRRWVLAVVKGEYAGWFALKWARDEDYYTRARRLPGSRYSSPNVVVPPDAFAEVLDFAEVHGFRVGKAAMEIAEQARARVDQALLVELKTPEPKQAAAEPETYEVADELLDEPL